MKTVTKEITFDCAHRLLGYDGPCGNIHGHTYRVQCTWRYMSLDALDISFDFKHLKEEMSRIRDLWDHKLLLNSKDPLVAILKDTDQLMWEFDQCNPTAEVMATMIKNSLDCDEVKLWETPTSFVTLS